MYFAKRRVAAGWYAVLIMGFTTVSNSGMAQQQPQSTAALPAPVAIKRRIPPPIFSPAFVKALDGVLDLETRDVEALENRLGQSPDDFAARLKLMAYCMRADRASLEESRILRAELMLWLVENQPDSEILGSSYAVFQQGELKPEQLKRATELWDFATGTRQSDARVMWNAANFYAQTNRKVYISLLENSVALAPDDEYYSRRLGELYAGAILTMNPQSMYRDPGGPDPALARRAMDVLDSTSNPLLLEPAVRLLQSEYNRSLMWRKENVAVGDFARYYFLRAKTLDPDMDEVLIFPQVDPKMVGIFTRDAKPPEDISRRSEAAAQQIRRLPPSAFPGLPLTVASVIRDRGCMIPQPSPDGLPKNVVRGEFFAYGQMGWAVLCSTNGFSSILVFRDDSDRDPEELAKAADKNYLDHDSNGKIIYSREIRAVDRNFIMKHYRAYGGPEPPPIDHRGIDDAFLEKASVTYYWHGGKWLKLQGAD